METPRPQVGVDTENNKSLFVVPPQEGEMPSQKPKQGKGLFSKNVKIGDKRTSVRLEPQMWQALNEIAALEKCTIHQLCTAVNDLKKASLPFTAALRVFLMEYYRSVSRMNPEVAEVRKVIKTKAEEKSS